jgi:hypothetical protein
MATRETPVLLLHGFWHGAWCWSDVLGRLTLLLLSYCLVKTAWTVIVLCTDDMPSWFARVLDKLSPGEQEAFLKAMDLLETELRG